MDEVFAPLPIFLFVMPITATTSVGAIISIMLWAGTTWATAPAQQSYLITLAPRSSEIALSFNTSIYQLGFAVGAGFGGVVIEIIRFEPWLDSRRISSNRIDRNNLFVFIV